MSIDLDFDNGSDTQVPGPDLFQKWVGTALHGLYTSAELSLRIVDEDEMTRLNRRFRRQKKSTNVLSFPADMPAGPETNLLGDIAICAPVIEREANEQGKEPEAHYAHMSVHGVLHLAGYDHIEDSDAERMEALEIKVLGLLGYANPYDQQQPDKDS